MSNFWQQVFASVAGFRSIPIPNSRLYLRLETDPEDGSLDDGNIGEALIATTLALDPLESQANSLIDRLTTCLPAERPPLKKKLKKVMNEFPLIKDRSKLRLYFNRNEITLKAPMSMSGNQWTPRGVLSGSTYEGGQSPTVTKAEPRDEWLDGALKAMLKEFK